MRKLILLVVFGMACGGGEAAQRDDPLPDLEPEDDTEVIAEPIDEGETPDPEPAVPQGPVDVTVKVMLGTEEVTRHVSFQMVDSNGETVHEGAPGDEFTVQSGAFTITASITDASVMVDQPTTTMETTLTPGEPRTVEVRFAVARVRLRVQRNGRPVRRSQVTLYREGGEEEVASFRPGNDHIAISPGRYEADVVTGSIRTRVRGLTFMDGATQNIPVNMTVQ